MEYKGRPSLDDSTFANMDAQEYMSIDQCCGGEEYFVCIVTPKNDAQNAGHADTLITQKSEQCKRCYWFNTAVYMLVQVK